MDRPGHIRSAFCCPVTEPIYPMRLTALAGSRVAIEWFVVADKRASAPNMTTEWVDTFRHDGFRLQLSSSYILSDMFDVQIGHPRAREVVWDGACVTKLTAVLEPKAMQQDIAFRFTGPAAYRQRLYSDRGADDTAQLWGLRAWTGVLVIAAAASLIFAGTNWRRFFVLRLSGPALAGCTLVWFGMNRALPRTAVVIQTKYDRWGAGAPSRWYGPEFAAIAKPIASSAGGSLDRVRAALQRYLDEHPPKAPVLREQLIEEDSPGNYTLHESPDGIVQRWYGQDGRPADVVFPRHPVDYYLARLHGPLSEWERYQVERELGETHDPRAVEPLIRQLPQGTETERAEANRALEVITRADPPSKYGLDLHAFWTDWWKAHRHETRRQWLLQAVRRPPPKDDYVGIANRQWVQTGAAAARELLEAGDFSGTPMLCRELAPVSRRGRPMRCLVLLSLRRALRSWTGCCRVSPRRPCAPLSCSTCRRLTPSS